MTFSCHETKKLAVISSTKDNVSTLNKSNVIYYATCPGGNGNCIVKIDISLVTHLNEYGLCDDQPSITDTSLEKITMRNTRFGKRSKTGKSN